MAKKIFRNGTENTPDCSMCSGSVYWKEHDEYPPGSNKWVAKTSRAARAKGPGWAQETEMATHEKYTDHAGREVYTLPATTNWSEVAKVLTLASHEAAGYDDAVRVIANNVEIRFIITVPTKKG